MIRKTFGATLVTGALLAACSNTPDLKELPGVGSACIDGMHIRLILKGGRQSMLPYRVLREGTDQEIDDWVYSNVPIAYMLWSQKFYLKEVQSDNKQIVEDNLYEFTVNECM